MGHSHTHHHAGQCAGLDHHSGEYTAQQRADLERVLTFNRSMAQAIDAGRDVSAIEAFLDPDPLRYMWVDEGQGQIAAVIEQAIARLAQTPHLDHTRVEGRVVAGSHQASRPSIAAGEGISLLAWIEWIPDTGEVVRASINGAEPHTFSGEPTDIHRPTTVVTKDGAPWVFWAATPRIDPRNPCELAVWGSRFDGTSWSTPEQISAEGAPSFNQEVCSLPGGGLAITWQAAAGQRFEIRSRTWDMETGWTQPITVSPDDGANVWDPTIAAGPDGGLAYAWSRYSDGSYQIVVRQRTSTGELLASQILTAGTDYALHPSVAITADGRLWCAYDLITVSGHGGSGPTRLRSALEVGSDTDYREGMREPGDSVPPELIPEVRAELKVIAIDDDGLREPPGMLAPALDVVPSGLPRLVATTGGSLAVAYRVHRRLPLMTYYWEVAVQQLGENGWLPPATIRGSDATLEEPSLTAAGDTVVVAAQTDGRLARALQWSEGFGGRECPYLMEHQGAVIWHAIHGAGVVVTAEIDSYPLRNTRFEAEPRKFIVADRRHEARRWAGRQRERYSTEIRGVQHHLYWGDLHRHSLVSRCTSGDEPSLEDFYRYSWDVCEYDFWAVTDHSENSSAFQWWSIQKLADLFHQPGRFVPLYGFEWTSADTGHQNVIFGDVDRGAPTFSAFASGTTDPAGLWNALDQHPEHPAITIPHHPGSAMVHNDWDYFHQNHSRLVEVFQACRGNYEMDGCFRQYSDATRSGTYMLDGLLRGHRFGLIASSDHGHGASYVGAFSPNLNRADIFESLHSRRTFAATTRDIVLNVRMGDVFMGEETGLHTPRTLTIRTEGYTDLARIDIVRNGQTVHVHQPRPDLPPGWERLDLRLEWGRAEQSTVWDGHLTLDDAQVVQTPFYSPEIVAVTGRSVLWEHTTHSFGEPYGAQRGSIEFSIDAGPDASITIQCAGHRTTVDPRRTATEPLALPCNASGGSLALHRGVGGLLSLGTTTTELTWTDDEVTGPAFYYVRTYLVDGEMAWSSPIWVG